MTDTFTREEVLRLADKLGYNSTALDAELSRLKNPIKIGDLVYITKDHNHVWYGIGAVSKVIKDGVLVKMKTGQREGKVGGFSNFARLSNSATLAVNRKIREIERLKEEQLREINAREAQLDSYVKEFIQRAVNAAALEKGTND